MCFRVEKIFFLSSEAVVQKRSVKKMFSNILQNLQENTSTKVSFYLKLQASACNYVKKETVEEVFSCGFFEIFKNIFSIEQPWCVLLNLFYKLTKALIVFILSFVII